MPCPNILPPCPRLLARLRNLVLRPEAITFVFSMIGLQAEEGRVSTITLVQIVLQWRMRSDLGLFSEPWTIEFQQVSQSNKQTLPYSATQSAIQVLMLTLG